MRRWAWLGYLGAGLLLTVVYFAMPAFPVQRGSWLLATFSSVVAVAAGVRLHRPEAAGPWRLFQVALALVGAGAVLHTVLGPSPSAQDAALVSFGYLPGVVCVAAAGLWMVRVLLAEGDRDGALDGAIVGTGLAVAISIPLFDPASLPGQPVLAMTLALAPIVLSGLLATAVRVLFLTGFRVLAAWMLLACTACALAGTLHSTLNGSLTGGTGSLWSDLPLLASPMLLAAGALHPSMAVLSRPVARRPAGQALSRLTVLGPVLLGAMLALEVQSGFRPETVALEALAVVLVVLLLVRLARLASDSAHAATTLDERAEQQAAVARLGQLALERVALATLLDEAAAAVAAALRVPLCGMFELRADGRSLVRSGGSGWPQDAELGGVLAGGAGTVAALALDGRERVVATGPAQAELATLAGWDPAVTAAVVVGSPGRPFGVLTASDRRARTFPPSDLDFLTAVANLLGGAIARWQAEAEIRHQAFHDPLSGLANRTLFRDRLDHALATHRRTGAALAVLFVDLDDFKTVNDSLGHQAGDRLLVAVAGRISACLRPQDTAARLGGDEFAVLVEQLEGTDGATTMAQRLLAALADPVPTVDRYISVGASVGIAFTVGGQATGETLLRDADTAMYAAKTAGKRRYAMFRPEMHTSALRSLELRADLERALDRGEMALAYQPIVSLESGAVVGAEALLRWNHPLRGLLYPNEFVALAEQTGLIVPLGRWVLEEACRRACSWPLDATSRRRTVSVNLSALQLVQGRVVEHVQDALSSSGLPASSLLLELTESVLLAEESLTTLNELRALGARLALDDFGMGYSSLDHLQRVCPDVVKVDRSFVTALGGGDTDASRSPLAGLARGIVRLAESLGVTTVGEGVESERQREELRAMGCHLGQGALFAMPLDPADFADLLGAERSPEPANR